MARAKRQFSKEFKSEAVRLSYQRENIKDLADELGIQVAHIYKWRTTQQNTTTSKSLLKLKIVKSLKNYGNN